MIFIEYGIGIVYILGIVFYLNNVGVCDVC